MVPKEICVCKECWCEIEKQAAKEAKHKKDCEGGCKDKDGGKFAFFKKDK
jgi:hypothetical protein